jgi:uncharacterized RDD family membrane protein YckC
MALLYEALLVFALMFFSGLTFQGAASGPLSGWPMHVFQLYLFLIVGLYFMWCWLRGGQTLPMKTWKLKLETADGRKITPKQALVRYILAWLSLLFAGLGFLWAIVDRDRQFLHDRLASTRIVRQKQ